MAVELISQERNELKLQLSIDLSGSMLEMEDKILEAINQIGRVATEQALSNFDTDGSPIIIGSTKYTSKNKRDRTYQTPYGVIATQRHVYQTSKGGKTYCPLESSARIINGATPRFAKILSNKYGRMSAPEVVSDMEDNHGRHITLRYLQTVSKAVSLIAQIKEEKWEYQTPKIDEEIKTVTISLDGTTILMHKDGYREAMVGAISLYDKNGDRHHTIYIGAAPEYGKSDFKTRLEKEINHIKKIYPKATYLGIADGAKDNWSFLNKHTNGQILDFYHATEYLAKVAEAAHPEKTGKQDRKLWLESRCHQLKHDLGAAELILHEMENLNRKKKLRKETKENLETAITYFRNNKHIMNYSAHIKDKLPIGSGVTEAACKTLIKQRFCKSGMRWKNNGIKIVLSLRQLIQTGSRWKQFWAKINQYGVPAA